MEKQASARKVPFKRGDLVVSLTSGSKFEFAGMAKPGEARVISADAIAKAVKKMDDDYKKGGMEAVSGDKYKYAAQIPNSVLFHPIDALVAEDQYKKAVNTPENKEVITKVAELEKKKSDAQAQVFGFEKEISTLNAKLFATIKKG